MTISVGGASGLPGSKAVVSVTLSSSIHEVAGVQNDIVFDPTAVDLESNSSCVIGPAIAGHSEQCQADPGSGPCKMLSLDLADCPREGRCPPGTQGLRSLRAIVISLENTSPIPDGSLLYACTFTVGPDGPATVALHNVNTLASSPDGAALPTIGMDGIVIVLPPATPATPGDGTTPSSTPRPTEPAPTPFGPTDTPTASPNSDTSTPTLAGPGTETPTLTPRATCTSAPASASFRFEVDPEAPRVGDVVHLTAGISTSGGPPGGYLLSDTAPNFAAPRIVASSGGLFFGSVTFEMRAVEAGTARLTLSTSYEIRLGCAGDPYPIYQFVSATSDFFEVIVGESPPGSTPTPTPTATPVPASCTPVPSPNEVTLEASFEPPQPVVGDEVLVTVTIESPHPVARGPNFTLSGEQPFFLVLFQELRIDQTTYHLRAREAGTADLTISVEYETDIGCPGSVVHVPIRGSTRIEVPVVADE